MMSKQAASVPCSFITKAGRPCRAPAVRDSDPPTCSPHLRSGAGENARKQARSSHLGTTWGENAREQACSIRLRSGSRENTPDPGFYGHTLSDEELADLVMHTAELTLDDEIACTRVAVRRTLEFLNQRPGSLSETEYLRAAKLVFQGTRTIARLLREQQALSGGSDSRFQEIMDAALDGLSEEWGIEL